MRPESDRQLAYDQLRERFLSDPVFRAQFLADPTSTMESAVGPLNDDERQWLDSIAGVSGDDLAAQLKTGVGAW